MIRHVSPVEQGGATMTRKSLTVPLLLALLAVMLVAGSSPLVAGADDGAAATAPDVAARIRRTTLSAYGTAWVPEQRGKFALWKPYGWGTETRVKLAGVGNQWVHLPIPWAPLLDESGYAPSGVQFCAKSSNGAQTKPVQIDLWATDFEGVPTRIFTSGLSWPALNSNYCFYLSVSSPPGPWLGVGVSVLLHFANTTDKITLGSVGIAMD
jgi:hypothetical protein